MKTSLSFTISILFFILLGVPPSSMASEPLPVIVSIAPQKYILERIAGARVNVTVLVKPGADPHTYEPTPAQMIQCAHAKLYVAIGVPFEHIWLPRIVDNAKNLEVFSMIENIQRLTFTAHALRVANLELEQDVHDAQPQASGKQKEIDNSATEHTHSLQEEDPHVWLSPMLVRRMIPDVTRKLGQLMPEHAKEFRGNARQLRDELEKLDEQLAMQFATVAKHKRVFLTFHPSWGYFAHNYELVELTIETEGKEPGPQAMKNIIDKARTHHIATIFIEPQFSKGTAEAVASNIAATVEIADPLAENLLDTYSSMAHKLMSAFQKQ